MFSIPWLYHCVGSQRSHQCYHFLLYTYPIPPTFMDGLYTTCVRPNGTFLRTRLFRLAPKTIHIQRRSKFKKSQPKQHEHNSQRISTAFRTLITYGHDASPQGHIAPHVFYRCPCVPTPWGGRLRSQDTAGRGGYYLGGRPSQQVVGVVGRSTHEALFLMVHRKGIFTPSARDKEGGKKRNYGCFERSRSEAGRGRVH